MSSLRRGISATGRNPIAWTLMAALVIAAISVAFAPAPEDAKAQARSEQKRPNVIVIMTDDQNVSSLSVMPRVRGLLARRGTTFSNSFVSYSLCCPSRSTFLTGQYAHNHGVLGNQPPDGGYLKLRGDETLPVWLSRAGYETAHIGKYLNGYGTRDPLEVPPGWGEWYGSVDPSTYRMWGYTLNENGVLKTYGEKSVEDARFYQTDVYSKKAADYIDRKASGEKPFFLSFAPLAPHGENQAGLSDDLRQRQPRPAPRHLGDFEDEPFPRSPSFDEADVSDKPAYVQRRPRLSEEAIRQIEEVRYTGRLESLQAVDQAVERIVGALAKARELDNTLILYTSDNGWMQGEHRFPSGKVVPYEESVRVPLIARGPGFGRGGSSKSLVSNVDLAPTILQAADATAGLHLDGQSLTTSAAEPAALEREVLFENGPRTEGAWYTGIRTDRYKYVEHSTGERELYDLSKDRFELESRHEDPDYSEIQTVLAAELEQLRTCAGAACIRQAPPIPEPR